MIWRYKYHITARYGVDDELLDTIPERVTKMSFEKWQIFYNGDPEHWQVCVNTNGGYSSSPRYRLPVYKMNRYKSDKYHKWEYRYVKFLTAEDYGKYNTFIDNLFANGEDYENLKEIEEFAEVISRISAQRLKEVQERTQKAIDDNASLMKEIKLRIGLPIEEEERMKEDDV